MGGFSITRELSIFVDESGSQRGHSAYCIVSLVLHEQNADLASSISAMEEDLRKKSLPDLPFHASPLMYGKGPYKDLEMETRKRILACFEAFCRRAPFTCKFSQVADCICTIQLTDIKFQRGELTETDAKIFGTNYAAFKKNHLSHIRKKEID